MCVCVCVCEREREGEREGREGGREGRGREAGREERREEGREERREEGREGGRGSLPWGCCTSHEGCGVSGPLPCDIPTTNEGTIKTNSISLHSSNIAWLFHEPLL